MKQKKSFGLMAIASLLVSASMLPNAVHAQVNDLPALPPLPGFSDDDEAPVKPKPVAVPEKNVEGAPFAAKPAPAPAPEKDVSAVPVMPPLPALPALPAMEKVTMPTPPVVAAKPDVAPKAEEKKTAEEKSAAPAVSNEDDDAPVAAAVPPAPTAAMAPAPAPIPAPANAPALPEIPPLPSAAPVAVEKVAPALPVIPEIPDLPVAATSNAKPEAAPEVKDAKEAAPKIPELPKKAVAAKVVASDDEEDGDALAPIPGFTDKDAKIERKVGDVTSAYVLRVEKKEGDADAPEFAEPAPPPLKDVAKERAAASQKEDSAANIPALPELPVKPSDPVAAEAKKDDGKSDNATDVKAVVLDEKKDEASKGDAPAVVPVKADELKTITKTKPKAKKKKKKKKTDAVQAAAPAVIPDMSVGGVRHKSKQGRAAGFCDLTPSIAVERAPAVKKVVTSNGLAKPAGKSQYASGELLLVTGRIYDEKCVPLRGAKIEVWQMDDAGQYVSPSSAKFANPQPLFAGSGRAVANNLGAYSFLTVFPNLSGSAAPYINVRVSHRLIKPFVTRMYFADDIRNDAVPALHKMSWDKRQLLEAELEPWVSPEGSSGQRAVFDVTVKGRDPFAKY